MEPEERLLLERTYKLVEENNRIVKSLRRADRISASFRILYWVMILGLTFGAFYFIQPYLETISGAFDKTQQSVQTVNGAINQFTDLFGSGSDSQTVSK